MLAPLWHQQESGAVRERTLRFLACCQQAHPAYLLAMHALEANIQGLALGHAPSGDALL
jgi:hypothetical protein